MVELTKKEWAHVIGVLQLDSMTGNKQSQKIFFKLSAMIRPDRTGEHSTTSDEPYNKKIIKGYSETFIVQSTINKNYPTNQARPDQLVLLV